MINRWLLVVLLILLVRAATSSDVVFSSAGSIHTSQSVIVGQYLGSVITGDTTWTVPSQCTQTTLTRTTEQFVCSQHGLVNITLSGDGQSIENLIHVLKSAHCYTWGVSHGEGQIEVWVRGTNGTRDNDLASQFYMLGEVPRVRVWCDKVEHVLARPTYTAGAGWTAILDQDHCTRVTVSGLPVLVNSCTIADAHLPLLTASVGNVSDSGATVATTSTTMLCTDHCGSGLAVFLNGSRVLFSEDNFISHRILHLNYDVLECGVMYGGVVLLLLAGGNTLVTLKDGGGTVEEISLPVATAHIVVNQQCLSFIESYHETSNAVLWSTTGDVILFNGSHVSDRITRGPWDIRAVAVSYLSVSLITSNSSGTYWVEMIGNQLSAGYELDLDCTSGCTLHGVCTHSSLVQKGSELYFVTSNGLSLARVRSFQTADLLSETPISVINSGQDTWAMLTSSDKLYYGYCAKSSVVELLSELEDREVVGFESTGEMWVLGAGGARTALPTGILLKNVLQDDTCYLRSFTSTLSESLIYLDKNETVSYNVTASTSNYHLPHLLYQIYPRNHILPNISSYVSSSAMVRGENKMVQSIELRGAAERGLTVIAATPEAAQPPCPSFATDITYVSLGCPKYRQLRIMDKPTECPTITSQGRDLSYTIPHKYREGSDDVDLVVEYDFEQLGCPIIWPFDKLFLPDVWIYDGEVGTRVLAADYYIEEVNSRFDFNFTENQSKMGCRRVPPSREEYLAATQNPDTDHYDNCFQSENVTLEGKDRNAQYKILNSTTKNRLLFSKHKANYTFSLTVVDPTASYCYLTTTFALWVEDAPASSNLGLMVLVAACFIALIILFILYFRYKKKILPKANKIVANG